MTDTEELQNRNRILVQLTLILFPFVFFFDSALRFRGRMNLSGITAALIFAFLNAVFLFLCIFVVKIYFRCKKIQRLRRNEERQKQGSRIFRFLPIYTVAVVFSVLAGFQFDDIPRYDAGLYYDALMTGTETFDYSLKSFLSSFTLWTHPMQGTALLAAGGEMLFPRQRIGLYFVILAISVIAIFCLYGILGKIFPGTASWLKASGTAVFAFNPYVMGLFSHFNADYFSLMFFVILVYVFSEGLDYLAAFLTLLLIFSKETGILFAGIFLVTAILSRSFKSNESNLLHSLKRYLFPKRIFLYGTPPALFFLYLLYNKGFSFGESETGKSPFRWDSSNFHCFGFRSDYISVRMAQFLFFNFNWLITLLFVASVLVYFIRKQRNSPKAMFSTDMDSSLPAGIFGAALVYLLFSCVFITYTLPRYNIYFAFPFSILTVAAVSYIWNRKAFQKAAVGGILSLFLLQNYYSLDPSFLLHHDVLNLGYQIIYVQDMYFAPSYFTCEFNAYNHIIYYSDSLINAVLAEIDPQEDDIFLVPQESWHETELIGEPFLTEHPLYWDPVHQIRTYDGQSPGALLPNMVLIPEKAPYESDFFASAGDYYLIVSAYDDAESYCENLNATGLHLSDSFNVENNVGYLTIYHFVR